MLENDETAQNLLIKSTIFLQSTPLRHALPLPAPLFFWFDQAENAFPFLHQNMRPLSSLRAESRTPSAGYTPPLPNRPVDCGYASILNRVARLRWIALISWAVFYRYQKTPTRISHFSLFTVKILVFPIVLPGANSAQKISYHARLTRLAHHAMPGQAPDARLLCQHEDQTADQRA